MFWIRQWSMLYRDEQPLFKMGSRSWDTLILIVFAKFGWNFGNPIADQFSLCTMHTSWAEAEVCFFLLAVCKPYGLVLYS